MHLMMAGVKDFHLLAINRGRKMNYRYGYRDHSHNHEGRKRKFVFNLEQVLRTSFSTCVLVSLLRTKCAVEIITKP